MGVILGQKIVKRPHLLHQGKEVGVIEEEDVQPHLNVIAVWVFPTADLAAHERTGLVEIDLVASIHQIHSSGQAGQTRTDDRDPHHQLSNWCDSMNWAP